MNWSGIALGLCCMWNITGKPERYSGGTECHAVWMGVREWALGRSEEFMLPGHEDTAHVLESAMMADLAARTLASPPPLIREMAISFLEWLGDEQTPEAIQAVMSYPPEFWQQLRDMCAERAAELASQGA